MTQKTSFLFIILVLLSPLACKNPNDQSNKDKQPDSTEIRQDLTQKDSVAVPPKKNTSLPSWPEQAKKQKGKRFPFDEAVRDPSLVSFRNQLYQIVLEKNTEKLLANIADDIKFSFGIENGKKDFIQTWQLDTKPEDSELWQHLAEVLKLGGGFGSWGPDHFYAPYIFVLEDINDPYTEGVITGENVRLRSGPDSKSEILGSLSWDLVEILNQKDYVSETIDGESYVWQKVKTASGQIGYVYEKYLRTPVNYRAGFSKIDGTNQGNQGWIMDLFIAGD